MGLHYYKQIPLRRIAISNTTTVANGAHNLTSKAFDAANNSTTSTAVNVTVTNQAVRGNFRYGGTASSCASGGYNDRDDLVFGVQ